MSSSLPQDDSHSSKRLRRILFSPLESEKYQPVVTDDGQRSNYERTLKEHVARISLLEAVDTKAKSEIKVLNDKLNDVVPTPNTE